jgi:acetyl/propionyl-CoA carboxylase alpha subunit
VASLEAAGLRGAAHAIEARVYAEDPCAGFLPDTGSLSRLDLPRLPFCRWDVGVAVGDTLCGHYDPLLAKLVVSGATRAEALARLVTALDHTHVQGVRSNVGFLRALASDERVRADDHDTSFIERERVGMSPSSAADALSPAVLSDVDALISLLQAPTAAGGVAARAWREGHRR